jgi:LuxR family maltose regulon positive regulatory protein
MALCQDDIDKTIKIANQALEKLADGDPNFRSLTLNVLGQSLEMKGDLEGAAEIYREGSELERHIGDHLGAIIATINLVMSLNELGRRREALAICEKVLRDAGENAESSLPITGGINVALSALTYEGNELERSGQLASRLLELGKQSNIIDAMIWGYFSLARVQLASGEIETMFKTTQQGLKTSAELKPGSPNESWLAALEAQAYLRQGELSRTALWAEKTRLSATDKPIHWLEFTYFTYVRLLLAEGRLEEAKTLLETIEHSALENGRNFKLITVYLQQALMLQAMGNISEAISKVQMALKIAAPEGYLRAFIDEGETLLKLLPEVRHSAPDFIDLVLSEIRKPADQSAVNPKQEILRMIARGRSNPEIAETLYLSVNTIKWHVKNIFGKLNANNRVEAVERGRELGLL